MANIAVTAANVLPGTGAAKSSGQDFYGETVTQGQPLYRLASDGKLYKALSDTAAHAAAVGIALVAGSINQPAIYQSGGTIAIGGTAAAGTPMYVGTTAGAILIGECGSGAYVTLLGHGDGAGNIALAITATGAAHV